MEKSASRLKVLDKIAEYEKAGKWDIDVEDDPVTYELKPNKVDYLNIKLSSKIKSYFANKLGAGFFEKMLKDRQMIIKEVIGIENYLSVQGGAIITCNHFNACDNYAVYKAIEPYLSRGHRLYKVIREGNYTNPPKPFGMFFRHCNTLPLSSNVETMKKFMTAVSTLLCRGEKILIYPEQGMWWNYRKPRPTKNGAYKLAVKNNVPVIPFFITMQDSDVLDPDGFYVQEYTIHIMPPLYPDENLTTKENIEKIKLDNYNLCKEKYEEVYKIKLEY